MEKEYLFKNQQKTKTLFSKETLVAKLKL